MKKRVAGVLATAVCVLIGLLRWLDLVNFTEIASGFPTLGPAWVRYAVLGVAILAIWGLSRPVSQRPAALAGRCVTLGLTALATGVAVAAAGGIALTEALGLGSGVLYVLRGALLCLSGIWFFVAGITACNPLTETPTVSAAVGVLGTLAFFWLAVERFAIAPASFERVGHSMLVLSALAALLFVASLVKIFYLQGAAYGRTLFATGMSAFLLGTCTELPQALCDALAGTGTTQELSCGVALGLVGVCGLVSAWYTTGAELPLSPEERAQQQEEEREKQRLANEKARGRNAGL